MKKKTTLSMILGLALCLPVALPELAFADGRSGVRQSKRSSGSSARRTSSQRRKPSAGPNRGRRHQPSVTSKHRRGTHSKIHRYKNRTHHRTHVGHRKYHRHGYRHVRHRRPLRAHYHYGYTDPCYDGYHRSGVFWDIHWQLPALNIGIHSDW